MRPLLLDLFCGAGGAAMGYYRAGFDVVGVDIKTQPHFPFPFVQGDALNPPVDLSAFDAIHASPPCQAYTPLRWMHNAKESPDLVGVTRDLLERTDKPYVIENVPTAPLNAHTKLCGTMFGLGTEDAELWRHRNFETNWPVGLVPPCQHGRKGRVIGVYGGHGRDRRRTHNTQDFTMAQRRQSMGIGWMNGRELSESIPPAFTEFIGTQLLQHPSPIAEVEASGR